MIDIFSKKVNSFSSQPLTTLRKKWSLPWLISYDTLEKSTITWRFFTFITVVFQENFRGFLAKETLSTYDVMKPKLVEVWY